MTNENKNCSSDYSDYSDYRDKSQQQEQQLLQTKEREFSRLAFKKNVQCYAYWGILRLLIFQFLSSVTLIRGVRQLGSVEYFILQHPVHFSGILACILVFFTLS